VDITIKRSAIQNFVLAPAQPEWTGAIRTVRYQWLSEVPGLVFGLMTLVFIVTSLATLA